ncbi:MAG: threonine synthase, partial [Desulfuromonadales bacterium]|nr:threonine synthase [Desulfuromonadales bacterium]
MKYLSTRGKVKGIPFKEAVMMGLAEDGGLLLPDEIPQLTPGDLDMLAKLEYPELAFHVMSYFIRDVPAAALKDLIDRSYATFDHPEIVPVVKQDGLFIMELFHGPTLAFKDVALQFLGNLFEYLLAESGERMNILGATSGDTGSAAIYGVRGKQNINIFILHPHKKVSMVQELQMTTVTDANVFNLAIRGTFDDGQNIVKQAFNDLAFKRQHALGAINSINWARVLAQVVYYFHAWAQVRKATGSDRFYASVPTGNFGDIFAGYIARRMGLPIERLILATNANNILTRFVNAGDYSIGEVHPTLSPSMDIQLASNFERYLYYLYQQDSGRVCTAMETFSRTGRLEFSAAERQQIAADFLSVSADDAATIGTIRDFHATTGYVLDPHTAVGVHAARTVAPGDAPVVCLATAHPAKFPEAVNRAIGEDPQRPPCLDGLEDRQQRCEVIDADLDQIKAFLAGHAV